MKTNEKIKAFRKKSNLTQKQLAEKSSIAEITIRKYEKGDRVPKLEQLTKIATALECSTVDLLDDEVSMFEKWDTQYPNMKEEIKLVEKYGADSIELLENYTLLNEIGKDKAREYIHDLLRLYKEGE